MKGTRGPKGEAGPQGERGWIGLSGYSGPAGPSGPAGEIGLNGGKGGLGPVGQQGPRGAQGKEGAASDPGPQGLGGRKGSVGPRGPGGNRGPSGAQGPEGTTGTPGPPAPTVFPTWPTPGGDPSKMPLYDDGYRYYKSSDGKDFKKEDSELSGTVYHHLFQLEVTMEGRMKPDGGINFPGKSCRDLQLCHPDIKSGPYYIDPDMGVSGDKFIVDCNFEKRQAETCIRPKQSTFTSKMDAVNTWKSLINDLNKNDEIAYDADEVALRYMRLNSMSVRQNITYKCRNQHAHRDTNNDEGQYVMVKTANGAEIDTDKSSGKMVLDVIKDECNRLDGKWHSAVFELETSKVNSLPITDVKIRQTNTPSEFEVELGPICFA